MSLLRTRTAARKPPSRGQSLVEFALILPVFLVLFSAALDLGRLAAARLTVANAAREGAFQASMTPDSYQAGQPCPTPDTNGNTPTTNLVVCRTILESKGSFVTIDPSAVTMSCSPSCTPALGSTATVKVVGQFQFLTPFMAAIFGGYTIDFASTSTTQLDVTPTMPPVAPLGATPAPTASPTAAPTATLAPTPAPNCSSVSAGFTMVKSPSSNRSPVTVTVTDTTTYNPLCVTTWSWDWGDGTTTFGQVQPPHLYYNSGPGNKNFTITLTVTSGAITSRFGGQQILVKP